MDDNIGNNTPKKEEKKYKNVYTILEKVRKGEIIKSEKKSKKYDDDEQDGYYNKYDNDGLFGRVKFWQKPDLIKPHMHWLDERRLEIVMDTHLKDERNIKDQFNKLINSSDSHLIPADKKANSNLFHVNFIEKYNKFPKHLIKDMFKLYYETMEHLEFEKRKDENLTKYKFLERTNNPVGKIMTEHSNIKSAIFTRSVLSHFISRMVILEYMDPDASKQMQNGLDGKGDGSGIDDIMKKMMDSPGAMKDMQDAINEATKTCKQLDSVMDEETQEQFYESVSNGGGEAGKLSPAYLETIKSNLQKVQMSMGSLKRSIRKLLDKSESYFSARKITTHEDLFNTDNPGGIEELYLLHPKLRKIFIEDIMVKDTKQVGKIDLYIDISGSMADSCGVKNKEGKTISKLDFAKAFAATLKEMDILNTIHLFNTKVIPTKQDIISISMIHTSGGTSITNTVNQIVKTDVNAIVITDAEDGCNTYSEKAFFVGINGANFSGFSTIRRYSENDQVVLFNGQTISRVGPKGERL